MTLDEAPRNSCRRENPFRRFTAAAESAILLWIFPNVARIACAW
jgi:hypothetical protein